MNKRKVSAAAIVLSLIVLVGGAITGCLLIYHRTMTNAVETFHAAVVFTEIHSDHVRTYGHPPISWDELARINKNDDHSHLLLWPKNRERFGEILWVDFSFSNAKDLDEVRQYVRFANGRQLSDELADIIVHANTKTAK